MKLTAKQVAARMAQQRRKVEYVRPEPRRPREDPGDLALIATAANSLNRSPDWLTRSAKIHGVKIWKVGRLRHVSMGSLAPLALVAAEEDAKRGAKARAMAARALAKLPAPCRGCERSAACTKQQLMCESASAALSGGEWDGLPRRPSAWRFRRVHNIKLVEAAAWG